MSFERIYSAVGSATYSIYSTLQALPKIFSRENPEKIIDCDVIRKSNLGECSKNLRDLKNRKISRFTPCNQISKITNCGPLKKLRNDAEKVLKLNGETQITEEELLNTFANNPNLEIIEIAYLPITDTTLNYIADNYPNLKALNVSGCIYLTKNGFDALAEKCTQVDSLGTSDLFLPQETYVNFLAANKLQAWITSTSTAIGSETLNQLASCGTLTVFDAPYPAFTNELYENEWLNFFNSSPNLTSIEIPMWPISDSILNAITASCKQLKKLDISNSSGCTVDGVMNLLENSKLTDFSSPSMNFSSEQFCTIFQKNSQLTSVNLTGLRNVENAAFNEMKNCQGLKTLSLGGVNQNFDSNLLAEIINDASNFTSLNIGSNLSADFLLSIKNDNFSQLIFIGQLKNTESWREFNNPNLGLKSLMLSLTNNIDSEGFVSFMLANPDLEQVSFDFRDFPLSDEQFQQLPQTKLTALELLVNNIPTVSITQESLAKFIGQNPNLEKLDLGLGNTQGIVLQAISECKQLKVINITLDPEQNNLSSFTNTNLTQAWLTNINSSSGEDFRNFIKNNMINNLGLWHCQLSSEDLVTAILEKPISTMMHISYANLNKDGLLAILKNSLSLGELFLYECNGLNPQDIQEAKELYPAVCITA